MSSLASPSTQEQQFLAAFQQAIETQRFDRMILSQYKGELDQLEKMTLRVISLQGESFRCKVSHFSAVYIVTKPKTSPKTIQSHPHINKSKVY